MSTHILRKNNRRYSTGEYVGSPSADILSNLISAWWGNGTTNDIYGTNNGILEGGLTYGIGQDGVISWQSGLQSFVGNGTNAYVTTQNTVNPVAFSGYSFTGWFNTTSSIGFPIVYMDQGQSSLSGIYDKLFGINSSGNIYFAIYNGVDYAITSSGNIYNDGKWHNAVVTSNNSNISQIFVDGVKVASGLGNGSNYDGYWKIGINHKGPYPIGTIGTDPIYFSGKLQDLRYYGAVLTLNQIETLAQNGPRII